MYTHTTKQFIKLINLYSTLLHHSACYTRIICFLSKIFHIHIFTYMNVLYLVLCFSAEGNFKQYLVPWYLGINTLVMPSCY